MVDLDLFRRSHMDVINELLAGLAQVNGSSVCSVMIPRSLCVEMVVIRGDSFSLPSSTLEISSERQL